MRICSRISAGVPIYGNADAEGRNAYIYEGNSFDTCGGHPQQGGMVSITYRYW